jgi:hypothetical protein
MQRFEIGARVEWIAEMGRRRVTGNVVGFQPAANGRRWAVYSVRRDDGLGTLLTLADGSAVTGVEVNGDRLERAR